MNIYINIYMIIYIYGYIHDIYIYDIYIYTYDVNRTFPMIYVLIDP